MTNVTALPPPDPPPLGTPAACAPDLRRHLDRVIVLFLLFMGSACVAEWAWYPERARPLGVCFAVMVTACGGAFLLVRRSRFAEHPVTMGVGLMSALALLMASYHAVVGPPVERAALGHTALLVGLLAALPWGWRAQLAVAAAAFAGFAASMPFLSVHDTSTFAVVTLLTAAVTTTIGAYHLERSQALWRDEAEVASALAGAGHILNTHLNAPDLLERVNRLAVELLGCDWSLVFVRDEDQGGFHLASSVGVDPGYVERIQAEFRQADLPIRSTLRRGAVVEVSDIAAQSELPAALLERFPQASAIYLPIRAGDTTLGILAHGYRTRRGPFTPRQRRLASGLADATSIAVGNARLIARLQGASRLKSEFVSTMSHELRTPLNVILGYADLLRDDGFEALTDDQRETVERIHRSALTLLNLVNATLDLNRLESGRDPVVLVPVELRELFAELARELEPLAHPGVALEWDSQIASPVVTDRVKLKTLVMNLAGNALKFTMTGSVRVLAAVEGSTLRIAVRDTGIGIAAADLPVIFEVFRQGDGSDSRRFGGVGLGLHIVRRLVEGLGGRVGVTSTPGVGSEFVVELPLAEPARATSRRLAA
jgi:signal transduction histidine kinase